MGLRHHYWTIAPRIAHSFRPFQCLPGEPWSLEIEDPKMGPVVLTGRLHDRREGGQGGDLVVIVHGLGGSCESRYVRLAAAAVERAGLSVLRLNLRGSDRSGTDFYHAGLTADLASALGSPELAGFKRIHLLGYSLGGHVALRFAALEPEPRLSGVVAVCAPLDLALSAAAIDRPALAIYKTYLVRHLKEIYQPVAARHPELTPFERVRGIRSLRAWDDAVVAPRHGFASGADYYAKASVAPHLDKLRVPALLLQAEGDPMVPAATVRPALSRAYPNLEVRWLRRAGHCGFPEPFELTFSADREARLEDQALGWLTGREA
ncbi:MAG TPA: alpha/beta fold hydrolase [Thermoanaerobaculia bacterium]|nr:alpha/beta fold hydrolase [Thermoanaerobaculia bacterium]